MSQRTARRRRGTFVPTQGRQHACTRRPVTREVWALAVVQDGGDPIPEEFLNGATFWVCPTCPNAGFSTDWQWS